MKKILLLCTSIIVGATANAMDNNLLRELSADYNECTNRCTDNLNGNLRKCDGGTPNVFGLATVMATEQCFKRCAHKYNAQVKILVRQLDKETPKKS